MQLLLPSDACDPHIARKSVNVQRHGLRDLDVELRVDDVVVVVLPAVVLPVCLDGDLRRGCLNLEMDAGQPLPRCAPHRVHDHVCAVAARDGDLAREVLQLEMAVRIEGEAAVDDLRFAPLSLGRGGRCARGDEPERRRKRHDSAEICQLHRDSPPITRKNTDLIREIREIRKIREIRGSCRLDGEVAARVHRPGWEVAT